VLARNGTNIARIATGCSLRSRRICRASFFRAETGLIVADAYGAHMHCEAPEHRLKAATRKQMTIRFAIAAAQRINRLINPQGHGEF
jgi:hypothetical protein